MRHRLRSRKKKGCFADEPDVDDWIIVVTWVSFCGQENERRWKLIWQLKGHVAGIYGGDSTS